jgi:hypothetical protein
MVFKRRLLHSARAASLGIGARSIWRIYGPHVYPFVAAPCAARAGEVGDILGEKLVHADQSSQFPNATMLPDPLGTITYSTSGLKDFIAESDIFVLCYLRDKRTARLFANQRGGLDMRYFIAAVGLAFALGFGQAAVAADGWGTQENGYGQYHVSNG